MAYKSVARGVQREKTARQRRRSQELARRRQAKKQAHAGPKAAALSTGAALALGAGLALAPQADAATFTVTNTSDSGAGSLRQAVINANANPGADVIAFNSSVTGTITLSTGQLNIYDSVDIQGPGSAALAVSGNDDCRIFNIPYSPGTTNVAISGLTLTRGYADGDGGAIFVGGEEALTLDHVVVKGSYAYDDGGGVFAGDPSGLTIVDSEITGNTSDGDGGGIYIDDTSGPVLIQRTKITGNTASSDGGGVYLNHTDDDVTLEDCTISGNSARSDGGGMACDRLNDGSLTLRRTTISGNFANSDGGGFYADDAYVPVLFENCTISGNTANSDGGGVYLYDFGEYGSATFRNSTIANNTATYGDGGGVYLYTGDATVENTIIADNSPDDIDEEYGTFEISYSLIEDPDGGYNDNGGNIFFTDPQLGPLQNNGGLTETMEITQASPAWNAGDPGFAPPPTTDQRGAGFARVFGSRLDMGAFEFQAIDSVPVLGELGKPALIGLVGLGAALLLRRRKLAAPVLVLSLAVAAADAGQRGKTAREAKGGEQKGQPVAAIVQQGDQLVIRLADGSTLQVALDKVQTRDRRHAAAKGKDAKGTVAAPNEAAVAASVAAGEAVTVRVKKDANGTVEKVRLVIRDKAPKSQSAEK